MTKKEFAKQRWGAGMFIKYVDSKKSSYTEIIAEIISVDFESYTIGIEMPGSGDLIFLPCEKCSLYEPTK